jgi:hypothetical protein
VNFLLQTRGVLLNNISNGTTYLHNNCSLTYQNLHSFKSIVIFINPMIFFNSCYPSWNFVGHMCHARLNLFQQNVVKTLHRYSFSLAQLSFPFMFVYPKPLIFSVEQNSVYFLLTCINKKASVLVHRNLCYQSQPKACKYGYIGGL